MEHCGVCEGTGVLLQDVCPLCDGESCLFTVEDCGSKIAVPSQASNKFFVAEVMTCGWQPLAFRIHITLGGANSIIVAGVDAATAQQIATIVAGVPPTLLEPQLPPIAALLQILAEAEWRQGRVTVEGDCRNAVEAVCLFYDELCDAEPSQHKFEALLHTQEILPHVYHVHAASRITIASIFIRFQEFYESADPSIRGQTFSLAECRDRDGGFDCYLRWPGFNLPSRVVEAVRGGVLDPLHPRERALLTSVDAVRGDFQGEYYVIGTCEEQGALHHEMAHALYALSADYHTQVRELLAKVSEQDKDAMCTRLMDMGYCSDEEILLDEMQAYMAGGDDLVGSCVEIRQEIQQTFRFFAKVDSTPYSQ